MSAAPAKAPTSTAPVKAEPTNPTTIVSKQVQSLIEKNALHLPADYSAANALKEAWLILQQTDGYSQCTQESICCALLDMVIWGLNPGKKQVYLIPYGKTLTCQRSYFGDQALAERLRPDISIFCDVIYKGEQVDVSSIKNKFGLVTVVTDHKKKFPRESNEIIGAYCGAVITETGEFLNTEIMDMAQIQNSWKKSKTIGSGKSFHTEQPDIACKRTVLRRWCKPIINASNDELLLESVRRQDEESVLAEVDEEEMIKGNGEVITIPPSALGAKSEAAENTVEPEASPEEMVKALGINGDQLVHIQDNAPDPAAFIKECYSEKVTGWEAVSAKLKDATSTKQAGMDF